MTVSMTLPSQFAAFFLCFLVVSGTSCPETEDMYPCECEEVGSGKVIVTCSGEGIHQQDVKRALNRMGGTQIATLKLEELENVGKLKGDFFEGYDILELDIDYCDIEELIDGEKPAFSGLEDSLEELTISYCLKGSASLKLSHLRKLRILSLLGNTVQELEEECFPDSLVSLLLYKMEINSVADRAFANLAELMVVDFDSTKFNTFNFKRSWWPVPSKKLRILTLDNNNLKSLPRDAFSDMPSLWQVYLPNNFIRSMDEETWAGVLPQLDRIDMRENPLSCDTNMKWLRQVELKGSLLGTCQDPADLLGVELEKWIQEDSSE